MTDHRQCYDELTSVSQTAAANSLPPAIHTLYRFMEANPPSPQEGLIRGQGKGESPPASAGWIRVLSTIPLILMALAWVLSPQVRDTFNLGLQLLWQGDLPAIRQWAADLGWIAPLVTGVLMIVQAIAAPLPAVLVTAANSLLFGPVWGGLYSILTANIAAALCYGLGRGYGTLLVDAWVGSDTVCRYEVFFQRNGWLTVLIARLIPLVPFDPISYVAGMVRMPFWSFFWATMLGQFPAGMAYSFLVQTADQPKMFAVYALCLVSALFLLGWLLRRQWLPDVVEQEA